ncbi:hypothetical protein DZB84_03090 [Bacillus sp. HNG]|nr:hypothetical protein DZB84_03090 [Bacillus sp. HNG]
MTLFFYSLEIIKFIIVDNFYWMYPRPAPAPQGHKPIASEGKKCLLSALVLCLSGLIKALALLFIGLIPSIAE